MISPLVSKVNVSGSHDSGLMRLRNRTVRWCGRDFQLQEVTHDLVLASSKLSTRLTSAVRNRQNRYSSEQPSERPTVPKRSLKVVKWLSATPAIGACTSCLREFKVPMTALTRTADAQTNLQQQFDRHKCEREETSAAGAGLK